MPPLICPECEAENPLTATHCQACGAPLITSPINGEAQNDDSDQETFERLSKVEDDLPGLLHALKQDGEIAASELESQPDGNEIVSEPESTGDKDEIPDWLQRIRQRANEEQDSKGEITQKLFAAQETLLDDQQSNQHENYASWIESLRKPPEKDDETNALTEDDEQPEQADETAADHENWLEKIRKRQGKFRRGNFEDSSSAKDLGADSLLQWLVALEDGKEKPQRVNEEHQDFEQISEIDADKSLKSAEEQEIESTREIFVDKKQSIKQEFPVLAVSREEQLQADQLSATIVDEKTPRPTRTPDKKDTTWAARLFVSVILIVGLSLSLFTGITLDFPQGKLQPQHQAVLSWVSQLPDEPSLLIVFDYQAGFSNEMSLVARPVLEAVIEPGSRISILSSSVSGTLLYQRLLEDFGEMDDVVLTDWGYIPTGALGVYQVIDSYDGYESEALTNQLPGPGLENDFDGVLILSDTSEGAQVWIEQFSVLLPEENIILLLTAQAGPMLLPYYQSGQVKGMVSGLSEAQPLVSALGEEMDVAARWQAFQIGNIGMVVMIMVGVIFALDRTRINAGKGGHDGY